MTAGRHPFDAASPLATLKAIRSTSPPLPSRLNPDIPAALDELIQAILHTDARLRPGAVKVEAMLAALAGLGGGGHAGGRPAPRLLVRRAAELAALHAALAAAKSGRGSVVCVAGEPGIGKTTLVEDFLAEALRK